MIYPPAWRRDLKGVCSCCGLGPPGWSGRSADLMDMHFKGEERKVSGRSEVFGLPLSTW